MKNGVCGNGRSSETTSDKKELFRGFLSYICTQLLRPFRPQNSKIRFSMNLCLPDHSGMPKMTVFLSGNTKEEKNFGKSEKEKVD